MADINIPPGLTFRKTLNEGKLFDSVTKNTKSLADNLAEQYKNSEFLAKALEKFEKQLNEDIADKEKEHKEYLDFMKSQNYTLDEIIAQQKKNANEIKKFKEDSLKEYNKTVNETQQQITRLKKGVDASLESYKDTQKRLHAEVKKLMDAGATTAEISAYLRKNEDVYQEASREMVSSLDKVKEELSEMAKNGSLDEGTKFQLKQQLRLLEKSYNLEEAHFAKQYKIFQEMNEELDSLQKSQEERDKKEKREQKGKFKDTLLTTMLGPFRLLTDPISQMLHNNRDTFDQLQHKTEQREEKLEVYEKSRKELNKLAEEQRENARLEALMSGADASKYEKPSISQNGMKALKESFTPKALISGLK